MIKAVLNGAVAVTNVAVAPARITERRISPMKIMHAKQSTGDSIAKRKPRVFLCHHTHPSNK